jgi:hypothetical protein
MVVRPLFEAVMVRTVTYLPLIRASSPQPEHQARGLTSPYPICNSTCTLGIITFQTSHNPSPRLVASIAVSSSPLVEEVI